MSRSDATPESLGIVGRSPAIARAVETLRRVAPTDLTLLLVGESGSGKEIFAQASHQLSDRAAGPFLSINCGALPETLLESELFGHEKGAFTGASESRKGIFAAADGGTLHLDEIGEMTPATQVRLLRVLESGTFTRVGGTEMQSVDVRVIAATNRDLEQGVARGTFRQDLYYRLNGAKITIPPLRQRREDIPLLFALFASRVSDRLDIPFGGITAEAMEALVEHRWPGNVRELKNFTERVITLERGGRITPAVVYEHLDEAGSIGSVGGPGLVHLSGRNPVEAGQELVYRALIDLRDEVSELRRRFDEEGVGAARQEESEGSEPYALPPGRATPAQLVSMLGDINLEEIERRLITGALEKYDDNRRQAADALGISERTLYRKINQYRELDREQQEKGDAGEERT